MKSPAWKKKRKWMTGAACAACLICIWESSLVLPAWKDLLAEKVLELCMPVLTYEQQMAGQKNTGTFARTVLFGLPVFTYCQENADTDWDPSQLALMEQENGVLSGTREENSESLEDQLPGEGQQLETEPFQPQDISASDNIWLEDTEGGFFRHDQRQLCYDLTEYQDFQELFQTFYAMDSVTMVGCDQLNLESLLTPDVSLDKSQDGPQILLYHTHSQEAFADSVPGDRSTTIVGAGDKLARLLTETYGYSVLHHAGEYDVPDRDSAYSRSLPAIEKILEENPSIRVIIDLHRDGISQDRKLVTDLDGRPTAQFMFFNGLSRTKRTGDIDYLNNPYEAQNLAFSFRLQLAANEYYPGLARRIYLHGYRYNMHLRQSVLIELGAQTNTVEEIMNAIDPLAQILDLVLSGESASQHQP